MGTLNISLFTPVLSSSLFLLSLPPSFLFLSSSHRTKPSKQVGPGSYRTQVQQAERLAPRCFSSRAKCAVVNDLFLSFPFWCWPQLTFRTIIQLTILLNAHFLKNRWQTLMVTMLRRRILFDNLRFMHESKCVWLYLENYLASTFLCNLCFSEHVSLFHLFSKLTNLCVSPLDGFTLINCFLCCFSLALLLFLLLSLAWWKW